MIDLTKRLSGIISLQQLSRKEKLQLLFIPEDDASYSSSVLRQWMERNRTVQFDGKSVPSLSTPEVEEREDDEHWNLIFTSTVREQCVYP